MLCVDLNKLVIKQASGDSLRDTYRKAKMLWYKSGLVRKYTFPFTVEDHTSDREVAVLESGGGVKVTKTILSVIFVNEGWRLE